MKGLQVICITLTVMFGLINGFADAGLNSIVTKSNGDPGSCTLTLTYTLHGNRVTFKAVQSNQPAPTQDCTHQDITTAPFFYIDSSFTPQTIVMTPPGSDFHVLNGDFTFNDAKNALGKSCALIGVFGPSEKLWTCRFKYSSIYFYMDLYLNSSNSNNSFDTSVTNALRPEFSTVNPTGIESYNASFAGLMGRLNSPCGGWNNVITNLSTHVVIQGTHYMSETFDLHDYISAAHFFGVLVKNNNQPAAQYRYANFQNNATYPFAAAGSSIGCTDLGITYGDIIPNLNFCANGCAVSLVLYSGITEQVLVTNGIHSQSRRLRT